VKNFINKPEQGKAKQKEIATNYIKTAKGREKVKVAKSKYRKTVLRSLRWEKAVSQDY